VPTDPHPTPEAPAAGPARELDLAPLLIGARDLARLLSISTATLYRQLSAGKIGPAPVKLGARSLWNRAEIEEWTATRTADGRLPDRRTWEALRGSAQRNGRPR
jgi:predicted DNA-binding transcriptional regulator AlpA